jgi:MoaA/NifB/PqqE/SkfB family radical SAM enzyme
MIRIVNWLLTRKCNLACDYCAIVKDYEGKPEQYPDMKHYIKNEMSTEDVLQGLKRFKDHNPDAFHIFYGGEPMLRKDLPDIISYCNKEDIHYTIISNNTPEVQPLIQNLLKKCKEIKGFSASVDPVLSYKDNNLDRVAKSRAGFESLREIMDFVNDVVAEVTVMKENEENLYDLIQFLSMQGINSDITFIDIAKSRYYDFSNITDENLLVEQSPELAFQFMLMLNNKDLDIHMKSILLPAIFDILPSNMDCEIDKDLHNVSVDADGTIRLCLRIRGIFTPGMVTLKNLFTETNQISSIAHAAIKRDKKDYCKLCNHTCQLMSKIINERNLGPEDLVHLDRRA